MEEEHDGDQSAFVKPDIGRNDESEVEEQTGYLDDPATTPSGSGTNAASTSTPKLGPSSLFALLAQRSAAQSQPPPPGGMPRSQAEYDDPHSWTSPRSMTQTRDSNRRTRTSARRRHMESNYVSSSASDSDAVDSEYSATDSDADSARLEQEWEEQLNQLKLMLQIIVFPLFGKYFGRKYAYYLFDRYRNLESVFTRSFWGF